MNRLIKICALILCAACMCVLLTSCGTGSETDTARRTTDDPAEKVDLVMWVPTAGGLEPSDSDKVMALVNDYLAKALPNTTLTIKYEDTNSYGSTLLRMFGAGEKLDICFTSYSINSYFDNVKSDTFIGFTSEEMQTYAPDIWSSTSTELRNMICVNNKYYAVINNQTKARQAGASLDTTMLRKYVAGKNGIEDYTQINEEQAAEYAQRNFKSFTDLNDFLAFAKSVNGDTYRFTTSMTDMEAMMYYMGLDDFGKYNVPGAIPVNATSADDIVNQFETEKFKQLLVTFKEWYGMYVDASILSGGITPSTYPTLSMRSLGTYKPGVEQEEYVICGKDMIGVGLGPKITTSTGSLTTMSAISYTSKNPIRALKFLNLLYTDAYLYNLLVYGREGTDYIVRERDESGTPTQIEMFKTAKYKVNNSWAYGNQFLAYPTVKQSKTVWEDTAKFNKDSTISVAYGFIFDEKPVSTQVANCVNVYSTYFMQLINNTDPYTDNGFGCDKQFYEEFLQALRNAGSDEIIAEYKKQFTAWLNEKEVTN